MPKKAKVKKDWSRTNGALLATEIKGVGNAIKDNANFKTPAVAPEDMIAQGNSLDTAYNNRGNGLLGRETYKTVLADSNAMMTKQTDYISETADGNVEIIASANCRATTVVYTKKTVPHSPQPPVLNNVNGELSLTLKSVKGAASYCYLVFIGEQKNVSVTNSQINFDPQSNVTLIPSGTTRECVRGLVSGTRVWVRALAQNSAGKSAFSPAVSICIA